MSTRIQLRRGTAAQWASVNPVLAVGEPGYETDTKLLRIGDGTQTFTNLTPHSVGGGPVGAAGGVLSGSYPNPGFAVDMATQAELNTEIAAREAGDALSIPLDQKGAANGVATLGGDGKIPSAQLPPLAISETYVVASQAAMLALTAQRGDVAVRTDQDPDGVYILTTDDPATLANWVQITAPGAVLSVNGQTGTVVIAADGAAAVASLRTLGTGANQAAAGNDPRFQEALDAVTAAKAGSLGYVNHGAVAGTPRPAGFAAVYWVGSVEPTNALDSDVWSAT